jgi:hypothetical protein
VYVRINDLTVAQGSTEDLLSRIADELVPILRDSDGFIAYYAMPALEDDGVTVASDSVTTVRIFEDEASIDMATQDASGVTQQLTSDSQLTNRNHVNAEPAVADSPYYPW